MMDKFEYGSIDGKTRNHRNGQRGKHAGGNRRFKTVSGRSLAACGGREHFLDSNDFDKDELYIRSLEADALSHSKRMKRFKRINTQFTPAGFPVGQRPAKKGLRQLLERP